MSTAVSADSGSLRFGEDGTLLQLTTAGCRILAQTKEGGFRIHSPSEQPDPLHDEGTVLVPLTVSFEGNAVTVGDSVGPVTYNLDDCRFHISLSAFGASCTPLDCASCRLSCEKAIS